ncbi:DUF2235 domain-containing protein [Variovorax dokdonensis]|uniref:DUF2235 domain-containing protein n=1 Tax=Variovorax dokdonensis TaxID=344883 RepID=A0ABT7NC84_9BURK|nr:DUF2235 domain-containing protein [Variovorax dokdonensis]MDM0045552.1 DUF2235 domain-containing protein [Variovorax dokdonensis]
MSNTNTILEPAAVTSPASLASVNGGECERLLNIGIFFDGTNNNHHELDASVDTNISKLFKAYRDMPHEGHFPQYVSGVGTPFVELRREHAEPGGGPFGAGGEARILYGLLHIINVAYRVIKENRFRYFDNEKLNALCSDAQVFEHLGESSGQPTKDQQVLRDLGLPDGLVGASDVFKKKFFSQECARLHELLANRKTCPIVKSIYFDVFGFSRGAAQARVFVTWLHRYMLMGGQIFGVPSYVRMLGLFDTVASVGPSDAAASDGHHTWASAENLQIHPAVKNCVHYIALHELRTNFPSDSVRVGDTLPPNCHEHITPGAHSDVGGGYAPLDQGKGVRLLKGTLEPVADADMRLSNMPLQAMYAAARRSCLNHPYEPWLDINEDEDLRETFGISQQDQLLDQVTKYFDRCGVPAGLPIHVALREHGMRYLAWRYVINDAKRFNKLDSVQRAEMYPSTYKHYKMGQEIFSDQVSALKADRLDPSFNVKAPEIFQAVRALARSLQPKALQEMGTFFDDWVHDSYAGFIGQFYKNGKDSTWNAFTLDLAERQGYMRWRNIYQGDNFGLNFPQSVAPRAQQ